MVTLPTRPYPGLRPFAVDEWEIFFGREIMTEEVIQRLLRKGLVLVHGSSGSGKSSLIYAGVLPQLERRLRRRNLTVKTGTIRPGRSPLRSLAVELAKLCASPNENPEVDEMHRALIRGRNARGEIEARIRETSPNELCIFIDQFEELFRFAHEGDPEEARIFADVVVGLAGIKETDAASESAPASGPDELQRPPGGIFAVLTMRSEFLGACTNFPGLAEAVNRTQYLLPNMARPDLLRAIREPATLYGASVDWELAERLAQDAANETDALPLIQHALMRLWEQKSGTQLRLADYVRATSLPEGCENQAGLTGIARIVAAHAEQVLTSSLTPTGKESERVVEYLFRALTTIDTEGRAIRRPQPFDRLCRVTGASMDILGPILNAFRSDGVSFVTPYESGNGAKLAAGDMIDVSHEALIRCWPRVAERAIDPTTGRPRGWLHREFQDGLIWRSLAVQAQAFLANEHACLDPATTEQRWPWFEKIRERPAWALRYLIERKGSPEPQEEPEWQAVERLMAASYERWQIEKNRTSAAELKTEIALRVLGSQGPSTYQWWKTGLQRARSVASIRQRVGNRIGTGFLVRAASLGMQPPDELLVLTNFHVVNGDGISPGIRPGDAEIVFEAADTNRAYSVSEVRWSSPVTGHDASVLRLQEAVMGIDPMPLASTLPIVQHGARVYIIGYPGGRDLAFSFDDNELLDHEGPPGGNPQIKGVSRVHYSAPTEPGSAGSPVFNTLWEVIAIHHMGLKAGMLRLNGKDGTYGANEGISILSIKEAIRSGMQ
jgi:hypothetical protein